MKLAIISDSHAIKLKRWKIPDADVLIHCGDMTNGTLPSLQRLADDLAELPHRYKLLIGGNHDVAVQRFPLQARRILKPFHYLEDESFTIEGIKFYGTPWQPDFKSMAFNLPRFSNELSAKWEAIPDDVDVLITHCPPSGVLDWIPPGKSVGCELLRARFWQRRPIVHCFGHVHESRGRVIENGTLYVNAACVQHRVRNEPVDGPVVVEIDTINRCVLDDYLVQNSVAPAPEDSDT